VKICIKIAWIAIYAKMKNKLKIFSKWEEKESVVSRVLGMPPPPRFSSLLEPSNTNLGTGEKGLGRWIKVID
jgi:hypothetical protein